ncbi:hypothetical protein [Streptomyces sp. AC558_RSS880]|uniref:hypothetical protein n=1 Tax=Streptomyces sp. AC558_RSS880 TaxID=2823687 RepID=UPI001C23F1AB|nr:hypothetical protein [Streptomyces sp. AC558_RSS880]
MSRWASLFSRRGGVAPVHNAPHGRAGRPTGPAPLEEVDGVVLLRSADDGFPSLADAAEVALAVGGEDTVTVLVGAPAEGGDTAAHWARLGDVLDTLRDRGTDRVRLVLSGAGHDRTDRPCLARRIADAWELEVIAPDGAVLITPGGTLFVQQPSAPAGGWWHFGPGTAPRPLGRRTPVPDWQNALRRVPARTSGGCVIHQIPAGVVIRPAEAPTPGTDDLSFAVPVHPERPLILVGAPDAEDVAAEEVATVLAALPAEYRSRVRLAPGGRRDLLRLTQSIADMLAGEVEVLTGIPLLTADLEAPGVVRANLISREGERTWQPYVTAVVCGPAGADGRPPMPRPVSVRPPLVAMPGGRPDFAPLTDGWGVAVTRAGLAVVLLDGPRPPVVTVPVDPDTLTLELGVPGQPLDESLLPALTRLLIELGSRVRARTTLLVRGRLTMSERALRDLATEYGVAGIRYVTHRPPGPRTGGLAGSAAPAATGTPAQAPPPPARPSGTPTASGTRSVAAASGERPVVTAGERPVPAPGERPVPAPGERPAPTAGELPVTGRTTVGHPRPVPASAPAERRHPAGPPGPDPAVGDPTSSGPLAVPRSAAGEPLAGGSPRPDGPLPHPRSEETARERSLPPRPTPPARPSGPGEAGRRVAGPDTARPEGGLPRPAPGPGTARPEGGAPDGDGLRGGRDVRATPSGRGPDPYPDPDPNTAPGTRSVPPADDRASSSPGGGPASPGHTAPGPVPARAPRRPDTAEPASGDSGTGTPPASTTPGTTSAVPAPRRPDTAETTGGRSDPPAAPGAAPPATPGAAPPAAPGGAAPARFTSVPYRPGHISTAAERAGFRDLAAPGWERHGAAVLRWLTRMPALRGQELEEARADLIALHVYLTDEDGPLDHAALVRDLRAGDGRLPGYAACLASALRRLPSHRGVAVRGAGPDAGEAVPEPGTLLLDPAPVGALALPRTLPEGVPVRYAIWSVTGRKVRQLLDRPAAAGAADEIVFAPGSAFRVLGTRAPHGAPVVLLRELPATSAVYQDGAEEELSGLDRSALDRLEKALDGVLPGGDGPGWPARCTGPVGHVG